MQDTLADIRAKLQSRAYTNEEHVRLSIVARVLQQLGWDIWNPGEVNTEYPPVPSEDKKKVDLALFVNSFAPSVFIEVKAVGKLQDKDALSRTEQQLRNYNRDNTAMFKQRGQATFKRFG